MWYNAVLCIICVLSFMMTAANLLMYQVLGETIYQMFDPVGAVIAS